MGPLIWGGGGVVGSTFFFENETSHFLISKRYFGMWSSPTDALIKTKVSSFADDTKVFKCIDSISDASLLQSDLNSLGNWSTNSGLVPSS